MSKIFYSKDSYNTLSSYGKKTAKRIEDAINNIPVGDIKKLQENDVTPLYRLRMGKYRVIYYILEDGTIRVIKIDTRGDIYK